MNDGDLSGSKRKKLVDKNLVNKTQTYSIPIRKQHKYKADIIGGKVTIKIRYWLNYSHWPNIKERES